MAKSGHPFPIFRFVPAGCEDAAWPEERDPAIIRTSLSDSSGHGIDVARKQLAG